MTDRSLFWLVAAIAAITTVTGVTQIFWPSPTLFVLGTERSATTLHLFGVIGMFMALFGGVLLHALCFQRPSTVVVLWAGLQKFGAVMGMGLGILHGIFSLLALAVVAFDFASALIIVAYLYRLRT